MLESIAVSSEIGSDFENALNATRDRVQKQASTRQVQDLLKGYLAKNPLSPGESSASLKDRNAYFRAIENARKDQKPALCLGYSLGLLTKFEPDADFSTRLWKAASFADWNERLQNKPEPLLSELLDLCDALPVADEGRIEGQFLRALGCVRHGDREGAKKVYEDLLRLPNLPANYRITAHGRAAENLEELHDYTHVLGIYREMESEITYPTAKDALLRAVFLNFEAGHQHEKRCAS